MQNADTRAGRERWRKKRGENEPGDTWSDDDLWRESWSGCMIGGVMMSFGESLGVVA
jgi:hypothetical protein